MEQGAGGGATLVHSPLTWAHALVTHLYTLEAGTISASGLKTTLETHSGIAGPGHKHAGPEGPTAQAPHTNPVTKE